MKLARIAAVEVVDHQQMMVRLVRKLDLPAISRSLRTVRTRLRHPHRLLRRRSELQPQPAAVGEVKADDVRSRIIRTFDRPVLGRIVGLVGVLPHFRKPRSRLGGDRHLDRIADPRIALSLLIIILPG